MLGQPAPKGLLCFTRAAVGEVRKPEPVERSSVLCEERPQNRIGLRYIRDVGGSGRFFEGKGGIGMVSNIHSSVGPFHDEPRLLRVAVHLFGDYEPCGGYVMTSQSGQQSVSGRCGVVRIFG